MSNLLLKAAQFALRTARENAKKNVPVLRAEDRDVLGATHYLGDSLEVRTRKLPFVSAALITLTDNKRGVRLSKTVPFSEAYLNVEYAYSDGVFTDAIAELTKAVKAI